MDLTGKHWRVSKFGSRLSLVYVSCDFSGGVGTAYQIMQSELVEFSRP